MALTETDRAYIAACKEKADKLYEVRNFESARYVELLGCTKSYLLKSHQYIEYKLSHRNPRNFMSGEMRMDLVRLKTIFGEGGKWHPKVAVKTGAFGDVSRGYNEYYQFPCCGMTTMHYDRPSQFRYT